MKFSAAPAIGCIGLVLGASVHASGTAPIHAETVLMSDASWTGVPYTAYPPGRPQLTVLRIMMAPHSTLPWHSHVVPNAAFVLSGQLTVEDRASGQKKVIHAGEALPESVGQVHRGYTGALAAVLIVTYAGTRDTPLSVPASGQQAEFGSVQ